MRPDLPMGEGEGTADDSEFYFAMIPEELIFSEVSDSAVRVYAAIQRLGRAKDARVTYSTIGASLGPKLGPKAKRSEGESGSGMSEAKVKRAIGELEKAGWLLVKRRRGPLGHNLPSIYRPLRSQATGTDSGRFTDDPRTIPSGVTGDLRDSGENVEPKPRVTGDPMPKVTRDPMPKVTGDPSIDSSLDSSLERTTTTAPVGADDDDDLPAPTLFLVTAEAEPPAPNRAERFGAWWSRVPKKHDRAKCEAKWAKLDMDALDRALSNYIASLDEHERRHGLRPFAMQPIRFLNGSWTNWANGLHFNPDWPTRGKPASTAEKVDRMDDLAAVMNQAIRETGAVPDLLGAFIRGPQAHPSTPPREVIDIKEISA